MMKEKFCSQCRKKRGKGILYARKNFLDPDFLSPYDFLLHYFRAQFKTSREQICEEIALKTWKGLDALWCKTCGSLVVFGPSNGIGGRLYQYEFHPDWVTFT